MEVNSMPFEELNWLAITSKQLIAEEFDSLTYCYSL
jgi:hypothetical protein